MGDAMLSRGIIVIGIAAALWGSGYFLGRSHAKTEIVEKHVEVIKYVEKKTAQIHARPNAGRHDLLELMRRGKL